MRDEVVLSGIVLATGLVGEYDRRLVILTKERGKITAFAKGVRKTTNQLISKSQIFVMGEFTLYEGRNAYTVKRIDVKEYFHELTFDMDKYCYGSYFCEMMAYFTHEGDRAADYLNLLFVSLNALKKGLVPAPLIRIIYEVKIMDVFGQGIQSFGCPVCGNEKLSDIFDAKSGGILCEDCVKKAIHPIHISGQALYTLQYINGANFGSLYNFKVSDAVIEELSDIIRKFMDIYVDKKFNSVQIINSLS